MDLCGFKPLTNKTEIRFKPVKSTADLSSWLNVWADDTDIAHEIFNNNHLANLALEFFIGYKHGQAICAGFLNFTNNAVGVSKFNARNDDIHIWSD